MPVCLKLMLPPGATMWQLTGCACLMNRVFPVLFLFCHTLKTATLSRWDKEKLSTNFLVLDPLARVIPHLAPVALWAPWTLHCTG